MCNVTLVGTVFKESLTRYIIFGFISCEWLSLAWGWTHTHDGMYRSSWNQARPLAEEEDSEDEAYNTYYELLKLRTV